MAPETFPPGFEWDTRKNASNVTKHGIDFRDAAKAFEKGTVSRVDDRKDYGERRINSIGDMGSGKVVVVNITHTQRDQKTRIISARRATSVEKKIYQAQVLRQQQSQTRTQQATTQSKNTGRLQAVYDRAQKSATNRGVSPENARRAAQTRVEHVREKASLNRERAAVLAKPTKQAAQTYVNKAVNFQARRVADLQTQAKRENTPYRGPTPRTQAYQSFQKRTEPRELTSRAQLENRLKSGQVSAEAYKSQKDSQDKTLLNIRAENFKQTHGYDYSQRVHAEGQKPVASSYDYVLHNSSYAAPTYQAPSTQTLAHQFNHQSQTGHGQGPAGQSRTH